MTWLKIGNIDDKSEIFPSSLFFLLPELHPKREEKTDCPTEAWTGCMQLEKLKREKIPNQNSSTKSSSHSSRHFLRDGMADFSRRSRDERQTFAAWQSAYDVDSYRSGDDNSLVWILMILINLIYIRDASSHIEWSLFPRSEERWCRAPLAPFLSPI